MNVDVVLSIKDGWIGVEAIIRAKDGFLMAALSKRVEGTFAMKEAETLALFKSQQWAQEVMVPIYQIETDSLIVQQALQCLHSIRSQ